MHIHRSVFGLVLAALTFVNINVAGQSPEAANSKPSVHLAAAADEFVTLGDVTLRYREMGHGEPVVLLHGYARTLDDWATVADALASTHRVIAMDIRGFGKSSKFADSKRFGLLIADDVIRLLDHLRITRAHIVGHSMGALIASNVTSRHPERVSTATLIAGPFYSVSAEAEGMLLADLMSGKGMTRFLQWAFPVLDSTAAPALSAQILVANDLPSLIGVMSSGRELHITASRVPEVPSLIICGTNDRLLPASRQLAAWWSGSRFVELPGADHVTVLESRGTVDAMRALIGR